MAVDDPLDFTPDFTMSTLQTSSEVANVVISSLIVVFILVNIGSAVSKLVYITRPNQVRYTSWLRGFIFANSDDPLRIAAWMLRRYGYRDPRYDRYPNRLRLKRLFLPLLARGIIFFVSVASIAITIQSDKILDGCENGDYRVRFDPSVSNPNLPRQPICSDIPLVSDLGFANATASSCICPSPVNNRGFTVEGIAFVSTAISPDSEEFLILVATPDDGEAFNFYVEWTPQNIPDKTFRSRISDSITPRGLSDVVKSWFLDENRRCVFSDESVDGTLIFTTYTCLIDPARTLAIIESRLRTSITWERTTEVQNRVQVDKVISGPQPDLFEGHSSCVVPIVVRRPIVNIAPLAIVLLVWVAINIVISLISRRFDNALDAAFHLIKEALGHDSTSNPLEECTEKKEKQGLLLQNWRCGGGGYHRGFLGRQGDVAVDEFEEGTLVSGCAIVRSEHETARNLLTAPAGFAAPGQP